MKELILIFAIAALTGCGRTAAGTNAAANTHTAANANTANTTATAKRGEPFAMHSAPKLIELVKKYKETINSDLAGKDLIVIGRAWDAASDGVYLNSSHENVTCLMSSEARADKRFSDVQTAKSQNPIVEVRGNFKSADIDKDGGVWIRLDDCVIVSLPNSSGS